MTERALLTRRSTATALLSAALLGTTLAAAPIAAAEPGRATTTCAQLLEEAASWPGSLPLAGGGEQRLYSDAFMTHLAGQAPCTTPGA